MHDWAVGLAIREAVPVPVFLAGGLNADNIAQAIRAVAPFGEDLCSGVRADGALDEGTLAAFMSRVQAAGLSSTAP